MDGFEGAFTDEELRATSAGPEMGEVMRFRGGGPGKAAAGALEASGCWADWALDCAFTEPRGSDMPF